MERRIKKGDVIVRVDPRYFRPTEVDRLLGDPSKAQAKLGWESKIRFRDLVAEMVQAGLEAAERDALVRRHGYATRDFYE